MLKTEKNDLQVSYETLGPEKVQLQNRVIEIELEKDATEEKEKQYQMHVGVLEGQIASLIASLKDAMEQKTYFHLLKEHVQTQRRKIHQLQTCIEEERCFLEILMGIMVWAETNKEAPIELPVKDQQSLKQQYDLLEFAINIAE